MPRDFARTNKKRSGASRKKKRRSVSIAVWLFTGGLVILLATLLAYLKWYQPQTASSSSARQTQSTQAPGKKSAALKNPKKIEATGDEVPFYQAHDEMVNKEVVIPAEDLILPQTTQKYYYTMRCGSFREKSRAEELKATIAFSGFESNIREVRVSSGLWHRVELGPYTSKRKAESVRHRLQNNNLNDCVIDPRLK